MQRQRVSSGSPYEPLIGFSRAVRVGNLVSVGGTAPIGADGRTVAPGDAAGQTRRCLDIIRTALQAAGADLRHVVRTRVMLKNIADWKAAARVHGEFFKDIRPASTMVQVTGFIEEQWLVEVEADAVIDGNGG